MEEIRNDDFILLNEGTESNEEGGCYSWPVLIDYVICDPS